MNNSVLTIFIGSMMMISGCSPTEIFLGAGVTFLALNIFVGE